MFSQEHIGLSTNVLHCRECDRRAPTRIPSGSFNDVHTRRDIRQCSVHPEPSLPSRQTCGQYRKSSNGMIFARLYYQSTIYYLHVWCEIVHNIMLISNRNKRHLEIYLASNRGCCKITTSIGVIFSCISDGQ